MSTKLIPINIRLTQEQKAFVEESGYCISRFVRKLITQFMEKTA